MSPPLWLVMSELHQRRFRILAGAESARSLPHLAQAMVLADGAGMLTDPELALGRMRARLGVAGIE
jgi:Protein of unknown function (DUF993)